MLVRLSDKRSKELYLMPAPNWILTSKLLPTDGQSVFVKYQDSEPRVAVFRHHPPARWQTGVTAFQLEHFDQWAPISIDAST